MLEKELKREKMMKKLFKLRKERGKIVKNDKKGKRNE